MSIISAYGPKMKVSLTFPADEGRTKQSFKDECDINNIMARFQKTGVLAFANKFEARYGDVTGVDFGEAMRVVADARSMFAEMPARLRDRFANDPARFLEFVQNPANKDETWTGRGKQPRWLAAQVAKGKKVEDFLIKK